MKWSLTAGKIGGIPIRLHVTLLLFIPYLVFAVALQFRLFANLLGVSPAAFALPPVAWGVILGLGVLAAILAHEWAHSAVALTSGVPVHSITLMMLGGVSRIGGDIVSPKREAWMAAAGPLASLIIGAASLALGVLVPAEPVDLRIAFIVFGQINIVLAIFNLLPAFPMDGGRILRAALSARMSRIRATRIAAWVGRFMAVGFALLGLFVIQNPILILIAAFVFLGAGAELSGLELKHSTRNIRLAALIDPNVGIVEGPVTGEELERAFSLGGWSTALVREPRGGWALIIAEPSPDGFPVVLSRKNYLLVRADDSLGQMLTYLQGGPERVAVVVDDTGRPLGVITGRRIQDVSQSSMDAMSSG